MQTNRFETFIDAIIAIIMTVLVLKIQQPAEPTLSALWDLRVMYVAYLISFLIIFNTWYNNHNLFQKIDTIDNNVVWIYGIMTFILSLIPYFTVWISRDVYSIPAETMFGLLFVIINILYIISLKAVYNSNPYNTELQDASYNNYYPAIPIAMIIVGFILTYTVFVPGIYVSCLIAIITWMIIARYNRRSEDGN